VFHILGLDEGIFEELILLKRNCLKFLQICKFLYIDKKFKNDFFDLADFSSEAIYKEPVKKITINEVICDSCYFVGDIDLFRSKNIQNHKKWVCSNCESYYDMVFYK